MAELVANACKFLESLQRFDLSMLLGQTTATIEERASELDWIGDLVTQEVVIRAPRPIDEAVKTLPQHDRKRIAEAVASSVPNFTSRDDIVVETMPNCEAEGAAALLANLLTQKALMISVATGGPRIQEVDDYYRAREARIRQALPDGIDYTNPHADLWQWYHYWDQKLGGYKERRQYIRELFRPVIDAVASRSTLVPARRETTGWERVDRALAKARAQLERASAEEDFQGVGLICREVLISLAQAVYDPTVHSTLDGVTPSSTDANRMLEAFFAQAFPGGSNKELRAYAKASLALALNLQHRRTATRKLASLCFEATASTTAVVSIIARLSDDSSGGGSA
jgi:hypothetical protein